MTERILPGKRAGEVRIPSSKSVVHRLLICAALGKEPVTLHLDGLSKDIRATAACLQQMGAGVDIQESVITVSPIGRRSGADGQVHDDTGDKGDIEERELPCGESGSTLRFLIPVAGALGERVCFRMEGRLPERPLHPFDEILHEHGMEIRKDGSLLHCSGQLLPGVFRLPGNVSSQYFSGLLMALPLLSGDSTVTAEGELESAAYIGLTEDALRLSGIRTEAPEEAVWHIPGMQRPALPSELHAEGDWSNAAFFLCLGALSEAGVTVRGLNFASHQGDRAVLEALREFGAELKIGEDGIFVRRGTVCRPIRIDAGPIPDLVPVLSVLACGAEGESRIENAARLRIKESDRLATSARLIRDLGGDAEELSDGLIIHGSGRLEGGTADSCNDHRIAMSAGIAASLCREPVTVRGAEAVEKSYPAFWRHLEEMSIQ